MSNDTYHGRALAEAEHELGGRHARLVLRMKDESRSA